MSGKSGGLVLPAGCKGSELLYANTFEGAKAQGEQEGRREWVMEGGGKAEWEAGHMRLRAKRYTPKRSNVETDHFVYWLNKDFPADFAVEWDFRFPEPAQNPEGLAIIFFSAQGKGGEDLFDPKLLKRDGIFKHYYAGDTNSFHTSYIAMGRGTSNLRKNEGFHLVASGPDLVTKAGAEKWQHLQVLRYGRLVELRVNGEVVFAWEDDGKKYGPLMGGGKIGFRQQNNLLWGDYGNLRVWGLKA